MSKYHGDIAEDQPISWTFNTNTTAAVPITLAGTPTLAVYKDGGITQSTAGLTLTVDLDSVTGLHHVAVVTTDAFYVTGSDYEVVLEAGTVDGVSVVGAVVGSFSIENRYMRGTNGANTVAQTGDSFARLGAPAGASVSADLATTDTVVDTLATRLSAARAALLDNIPAGTMPTQAEVLSIQNNTRTVIGIPTVAELPDAGSTRLKIYLNNYDTVGNMEEPDSAPTVTVENEEGTTRTGNLQHPTTHVADSTMVELSTGRYWIEYDLDNADALESLIFSFSVTEGGATRVFDRVLLVVDTTAVDFTAADRTSLGNIEAAATEARLAELDAANLPTDIAGVAAATLAAGDIDGFTLEEAMKLCLAGLAGKLAGAAGVTVTIQAADDSKTRITATVDADGNRTAVTLDAAG